MISANQEADNELLKHTGVNLNQLPCPSASVPYTCILGEETAVAAAWLGRDHVEWISWNGSQVQEEICEGKVEEAWSC